MFDIPMNSKEAISLSAPLSNGALNIRSQQNSQAGFNNAQQNIMNINNGISNGIPQQNTGMYQQNMNINANAGAAAVGATHHYEKPSSGGVILKKGAKSKLATLVPDGSIRNIKVCLGWDTKGYQNYDLDSSCFMLGANKKVVGDDWFVFYNQPVSPDRAIIHNGDNKTGVGDGDDEIISIDLGRLDQRVERLVFVITINDAIEMGYNFGCVSNAFARIVDVNTNKELAIFNLTDYYSNVTAMVVFEIYKHNGEWKINPVGNGLKETGLIELCNFYGVNVGG